VFERKRRRRMPKRAIVREIFRVDVIYVIEMEGLRVFCGLCGD